MHMLRSLLVTVGRADLSVRFSPESSCVPHCYLRTFLPRQCGPPILGFSAVGELGESLSEGISSRNLQRSRGGV